MKKFLLALLCVLLTAGFAFAVDVDLKGMYNARGNYVSNNDGLQGDAVAGYDAAADAAEEPRREDRADYFFFDHELDLTARLLVTDKTRIVVNMEIKDETWLAGNTDNRSAADQGGLDDEIDFKRVYGSHTFDAYGTVLDLGLMTGGAWMTGFGDNGNGRYRVKVTQPTEFGPVIAIYEKNYEEGARFPSVKDAEDDDSNAYYLAMVTKLGDFNIYPLIGYSNNSYGPGGALADRGSDSQDTFLFFLGTSATFGDFGFEAEFNYFDTDNGDFPGDVDDFSRWGLYGNGWMSIGAGKVGLLAAYGSWDDDTGSGFGFGEDFTPTVFGADHTNIGTTSRSEYMAVTMLQLYGSLALSEELSLNAAGLYWMSNSDEDGANGDDFWKDADGYELSLGLDWKLTDQVTYTIASGFGKISLDSNAANAASGDSPDAFAKVYHKFQIDF